MVRHAEVEFDELVDRWVCDAIRGEPPFDEFMRSLPGIYPSVARDALRRLASRGKVSPVFVETVLADARQKRRMPCGPAGESKLPVPHPLDYEWRYAESAVDRLVAVWDRCVPPGPLLLLGAPSVVTKAVRHPLAQPVMALDVNATVVAALRNSYPRVIADLCDLTRDDLPDLPLAAMVVCDPPWYPGDMRAFLWAGCRLCRARATVLVSLPPLGTRPGMNEERDQLLRYARRLGLDLVSITSGALPYVSPPFEQNALRADGLAGTPLDWRRGDLAEFVWLGEDPGPRPSADAREGGWVEVAVDEIRIRVRQAPVRGFIDPSLLPIVPDNVLPTVSRRDPRRQLAAVWTAGNRIFGCQGPGILAQVLRSVAARQDPVARVEAVTGGLLARPDADQVRRTAAQIRELVQTEKDEQASWKEQCHREGVIPVAI